MIQQRIYIPRYGWSVRVWYAVTGYHTLAIMRELDRIGCDRKTLAKCRKQLETGGLNSGLTYSNYDQRKSVVVIALTSNAGEFRNSLAHEKRHLVTHIATATGMDLKGEEVCYLDGWLAEKMMKACASLACECCRGKARHK